MHVKLACLFLLRPFRGTRPAVCCPTRRGRPLRCGRRPTVCRSLCQRFVASCTRTNNPTEHDAMHELLDNRRICKSSRLQTDVLRRGRAAVKGSDDAVSRYIASVATVNVACWRSSCGPYPISCLCYVGSLVQGDVLSGSPVRSLSPPPPSTMIACGGLKPSKSWRTAAADGRCIDVKWEANRRCSSSPEMGGTQVFSSARITGIRGGAGQEWGRCRVSSRV